MAFDEGPLPDEGRTAPSAGSLQYIIHHVFLPPKLPQKSDAGPDHDRALTKHVLQALEHFEAIRGQPQANVASPLLIRMLKNMIESRNWKGGLTQDAVECQMSAMKNTGTF